MRSALQQLPGYASVFATNNYTTHLSQREVAHTYIFPGHIADIDNVEYIFFNLRNSRHAAGRIECVTYDTLVQHEHAANFRLAFSKEGVVVLQRAQETRQRC